MNNEALKFKTIDNTEYGDGDDGGGGELSTVIVREVSNGWHIVTNFGEDDIEEVFGKKDAKQAIQCIIESLGLEDTVKII